MHQILKCYSGSIAYGTNLPTSDIDIRGIFCATPINIRTPFFPVKEQVVDEDEDTKYYELSHFMKLALACNPNILELLWVDESDIIFNSDAYRILRSHRDKLLSRKVAHTFTGYAFSQIKRIKGHHKWINNPQEKEAPKQKNFVSMIHNFTEEKIFKIRLEDFDPSHQLVHYGNNIFGIVKSLHEGELFSSQAGHEGELVHCNEDSIRSVNPLFIVKYNEDEYREAIKNHKHYWGWVKNRNTKRSKLEAEHGYDTKHAMHLVRLLRMGLEILETGVVKVKRKDAQELLSIRNGAWSYEELLTFSTAQEIKINDAYEKSSLRKKPDIKFAANLLMEIQDKIW